MAIQFVQTISGHGEAVNSQTFTLGGSTVAGNFLAMCVSVWDEVLPTNVAPTGLGTWNTTTGPTSPDGRSNCFINYNENCTAGTQASVDYGTTFYIEGSLSEFSGLLTSGSLDKQKEWSMAGAVGSPGQDLTPDTPATDVTTQANELVLASLDVDASVDDVGIDAATPGYTNLHVWQDASGVSGTQGHSSDYKIVSATGAQQAAWGTLNGNYDWSSKIATFKAAAAAASQFLYPFQDISAGGWFPSSGSPAELWDMIDGTDSPDMDYAYTLTPGTMEVKFSPGNNPTTEGGTLRYRLTGFNGTTDAIVRLKQGNTVLAEWTHTNVPAADTAYSQTLTVSPSISLTDATDLRLSVEAV